MENAIHVKIVELLPGRDNTTKKIKMMVTAKFTNQPFLRALQIEFRTKRNVNHIYQHFWLCENL